MSAIRKSLWFIESRFREEVTLEEMARTIGLSRFYLSRIFPLTTGMSISAYVRGRRLSEAAKELAAGAPDILSVALAAGYGSHEAFTRAFKDLFGLTPEEVRRRGSLDTLELVEPYAMSDTQETPIAEPVIVREPAMRLIGLRQRQEMNGGGGIPAQWQKFAPYIGHIEGQRGVGSFGVVGAMYDDCDDYDYYCAVAAEPDAVPPEGLEAVDVPAQTFARFTHTGHISNIRDTISAAYGDWLPRSGYRGRDAEDGISFLEYYGPDFDGRTGKGTVEIWIGLKD